MIVFGPMILLEVTLIVSNVWHIITEMIGIIEYITLPQVQMARETDGNDVGNGSDAGIAVRTKPKTKKPAMYQVIMLNDDYTPMEFVILVLERFFSKSSEEATQIMMHVHQKGVGVCGVFTFEVAEMKVQQVMDLARQHQHPLQCTLEKAWSNALT